MKWKSPRCSPACWDEIRASEAENTKTLLASVERIRDLTRDRDEWREQHENLLAMYQAANAELALLRPTPAMEM
jgi:N-dimethylarginine dimethylaminohydrolase